MNIVGLNLGTTAFGKRLRQGGTALRTDEGWFALSEERVTGVKYAAGYEQSVSRVLKASRIRPSDIDQIAVSTCCEHLGNIPSDPSMLLEGAVNADVLAVNHHESHAALAFYGSGFDEALVVVVDAGGNVLDADEPAQEWWTHSREQHSYFVGNADGLTLVGRDFSSPYEVGLGEMYRAATYFLGWHSATLSARTMALAAHGRRDAVSARAFSFDEDRLISPVTYVPNAPVRIIEALSDSLGVDFGEPRQPNAQILQIHKDFAAFIQRETELALLEKLSILKKQFNIDKLCLSGGLALNVVANGRLLESFPGGVYVPSAPGDDGQCLGNALVAARAKSIERTHIPLTKSHHAYLGPAHPLNSAAVAGALAKEGASGWVVFETTDYSDVVARLLASGSMVCIFQERSEFGPRALGARSILSNPRKAQTATRLNMLKGREWFMPFAPVVLVEHFADWFESSATVDSPFMSFAVKAKAKARKLIPAVLNEDLTSRVQTVNSGDDSPLVRILKRFYALTDIPILLNTSFNLGGSPIVESLEQAVAAFRGMPINAMAVGRFVVVKNLSPDLADLPIPTALKKLRLVVHKEGTATDIQVSRAAPWALIRSLQELTGSVVFVRTELPLYGPYLEWMREGRKVTTIRFRKGAVEVPFSDELPLFVTEDFSPGDRSTPIDSVRVSALRYRVFGELTSEDAVRDGFRDLEHMRHDLNEIYPGLSDEDWVTVYDIQLASVVDATS